jgi:flagellar biosynthesis/type III secretory pathway M-ring protein FliF/YscJ
MVTRMETETRWEKSDNRLHSEETLPEVEAKQGRSGIRVLTVLVAALVLAFIVWIPIEIWGNNKAEQAAPQPPTQSQITATAPKAASETPAEVDAKQR